MTVALPRVQAASHVPQRQSGTAAKRVILGPARLGLRILRSVSFRSRRAFTLDRLRLFKRDILFPLRNTLLPDRPISFSIMGESFLMTPQGAVPREVWAGRTEKCELQLILSALDSGMTFIDVGANAGFFSIPAARRVQSGRVFAFEPSQATYRFLLRNIALNQAFNIHPFSLALGDVVGQAVLNLNADGKDGLNTLGNPTHPDCEIVAQQTVQIETLDAFALRNSIPRVDVMKIDVEGAELLVLRGAAQLLARLDAPMILFEYSSLTAGFSYHPVESLWFLEKLGFSFFFFQPKDGSLAKVTDLPTSDTNVIAAKPSHPMYHALQDRAR